MSLKEDFDGFDPASETQKAHDNALSNNWDGEILEPWTLRRESAALLMGCKMLSDLAAFQRFFKTGTYPSVLQDVIIVLWLLSIPKEAVLDVAKLGEDRAKEKLGAAFDWAEDNNISRGSKSFKSGVDVVAKIMAEKLKSHFESEGEKSEGKKKGLARRGSYGSHSALVKRAGETKAS